MGSSKIGVVLSSGGGRGVFAHTGFMCALESLEVPVSASAGCSAGAVVAGMLASGRTAAEWKAVVTQVDPGSFWTPRPWWRLAYALSMGRGRGLKGLSDTAAALRFLESQLKAQRFEGCIYPFWAVAINLGTGEKAWLHEGPLAPAMMASAAMPGLYDPVEIDGEYFTDGALIDLAPAEAICCRYGLDGLLIHHVAQRGYDTNGLEQAFGAPWTLVNILHRLIYRRHPWYATGQPRSIIACPCGCKATIVILEPDLPELVWPLTRGGSEILHTAQKQAVTQIAPIREALLTRPAALREAAFD